MLTLPEKFNEFLKKAESTPATLVKLGDTKLENIQSSQGDWENNSSETQVDYASEPGSVILGSDTIPPISQTSEGSQLKIMSAVGLLDTSKYVYGDTIYNGWQSFRQTTGSPKFLDEIAGKFQVSATTSATIYCQVFIYFGFGLGPAVSTTLSSTKTTGTHVITFDFSDQNIPIYHATRYWIKFSAFINPPYTHLVEDYVMLNYTTTTSAYANGQLDAEYINVSPDLTNIGDAYFTVTYFGEYYLTPGDITTQIIDLGETPAENGEWKFNDLRPNDFGTTDIVYTCYGSTDNFVASDVTIGVKEDGDAIESGDWYRYYKIKAELSSTTKNETPVVQDVGLTFITYKTFSDRDIFGYEQNVDSISSLSTKIDDFELATVSQLTCKLGLTKTISNYLFSNYPKNKVVRISIGFDDAQFLETDFIEIYVGAIESWKINTKHYVDIIVKDISKSWAVDIPKETTTSAGNYVSGTYQALNISAEHPVDVMLEILQNHINVRDADIDFGSFEAVKTALSGWVVTRDLTGEQEKADTLLNELRILTSTYFLPSAVGKITLKQYDDTETAIETLTDDDFLSPLLWESNSGLLYNKTFLQFDWTGAAFGHVYIGIDLTSISNHSQTSTFTLEDKWTLNAQVAQIQAVNTFILDRYADPPAKITGTLDREKLYFEVGDMVNITTTQAPSTDLSGITAKKFQIAAITFDQIKSTVKCVFLEV
jgi:hypothetical protein